MDPQNTHQNQPVRVGSPLGTTTSTDQTPMDKDKGVGRRTILYARVSTADQNLAHQREQAEAAGFHLDEVLADHGISGVSTTLRDRPEGRRLFDILRAGDVLVVRWVDRLGRNYRDVTDTIQEFIRRGVIVRTVINNMVFDGSTKDPMQQAVRDALIAFMAATAQAQAEASKEAQRARYRPRPGKRSRHKIPRPKAIIHLGQLRHRPGATEPGPRRCGNREDDRAEAPNRPSNSETP
jgi:putative DNA-invertase from lambdoid prophage Rac